MMTKDIFNKITSIKGRIENSLKDEDFVSISELSKELDQSVRKLSETLKSQQFTDPDRKKLEMLSTEIENFKKSTIAKFKDYTSKVSKQTKMHQAYNR